MLVRNLKIGVLLLIAIAAIVYFSSRPSAEKHAAKSPESRKAAPDFTLKDANGAQVKLSDYRGKVVLLNFWATWCGPCKIEIPWFMEFEQQYRDKGFAVLGVSMDDDGWNAVKPYISEHKLNYRVVLGNDSVGTLYGGIDSLPTTFVIDRTGKIDAVHVGLVGKNDYLQEIQSLLAEDKHASAERDAGPVSAFLTLGSNR